MAGRGSSGSGCRNTILVILGLGLLGIFSCVGLVTWGTGQVKDAEVACNGFLDLLASGRVQEAYIATAPAFQTTVTPEQFSEMVGKYPAFTSHTKRTQEGWEVRQTPKGELATLRYKLTGTGSPLSLRIALIHKDSAWTVTGMALPPPK